MTDLRKAAQQALDILNNGWNGLNRPATTSVLEAVQVLTEALAQPEPDVRDLLRRSRNLLSHPSSWWEQSAESRSRLIGELDHALAQQDKFCDTNCIWTDHHPDCALAQPEQGGWELPHRREIPRDALKPPEQVRRTMIENFILGLADEAIKNPDASIHDLIGRLGYVHKTKLPKHEQEPVAWINEHGHIDRGLDAILDPTGWTPLYTAPPQRKPLTEEEMLEVLKTFYFDGTVTFGTIVRAIEKAHGIGVAE